MANEFSGQPNVHNVKPQLVLTVIFCGVGFETTAKSFRSLKFASAVIYQNALMKINMIIL